MVVKINGKSVKVEEDEASDFSWTYLVVTTIGYLLGFYVLDYAAFLFMGVSPFPAIKFIGVILSWFSS